MASNDRMIDELQRMWMEAVMAWMKYYDVMTEKPNEKPPRIDSVRAEIQTEHLQNKSLDQHVWLSICNYALKWKLYRRLL
jgi:hypothetical protein